MNPPDANKLRRTAKSRNRILFYVGVNLIVVLLLGVLMHSVTRIVNDIILARAEIAKISLEMRQLEELRAASEDANLIMEELKQILPGTEELLFVSTHLEERALRMNLGFGFQYGAVDEGPPRAILFTMFLTGDLGEIIQYIEMIRAESPYIFAISSMESRAPTEEDGHNVVLSGKLFIR